MLQQEDSPITPTFDISASKDILIQVKSDSDDFGSIQRFEMAGIVLALEEDGRTLAHTVYQLQACLPLCAGDGLIALDLEMIVRETGMQLILADTI